MVSNKLGPESTILQESGVVARVLLPGLLLRFSRSSSSVVVESGELRGYRVVVVKVT